MIKLAKREEEIMRVFWKLDKAFIKEIIPHLPKPQPHYNSVATMVKILEPRLAAFTIVATAIMLFVSRKFFRYALRRYRTASS